MRKVSLLAAGMLLVATSNISQAGTTYPPNVYYPFGTATIANDTHHDKNGNQIGWNCGYFDLPTDTYGYLPTQFKGSGGIAAKIGTFMLVETYTDPDTSDYLVENAYFADAVLTYTSATGGEMSFGAAVNMDGVPIVPHVPFRVTNMRIGPGNVYLVLHFEVDFPNCTVAVNAVYTN